jgi:hypothetical protein
MTPATSIFGPVVALVLWNLFIEVWFYSLLIPTVNHKKIKVKKGRKGEIEVKYIKRKRIIKIN